MMRSRFAPVRKFFESKQIPIIMGEWGLPECFEPEERLQGITAFITIAKEYGIPCFWWECGNAPNKEPLSIQFAFYNRYQEEWYSPELLQTIMDLIY